MMNRSENQPASPIWLLGDSEPQNWREKLAYPLDPRHPIRHNIWTSVLDIIQDKLYRNDRLRIDSSKIYIRNAIGSPSNKPRNNQETWNKTVQDEINEFTALQAEHHPFMILSLGAFAFEFARRSLNQAPPQKHIYWNTEQLGLEFKQRITTCNSDQTNLIPLLHRSIAGGHFLASHKAFIGSSSSSPNYFEHVGTQIADVLLREKDNLKIWI